MHCDPVKDIWEKLQNVYKGDAKIKGAKVQTYRGHFEQLKIKEDGDIATYFLQVDEIVNTIKGLGEEIKEPIFFQKVLRSFPMRFDPKIPAPEEREDISTLSMDVLHGILIAYEMITYEDNPSRKVAYFKASNNTRKNKQKSKLNYSCSDDLDEDEEIANFVRKLKRGTDKYKGKIPLKCFNCCKIGHFSAKCPYVKN